MNRAFNTRFPLVIAVTLGLLTVLLLPSGAVTAEDALVARYDTNGNGTIEKNEVIAAINDYLFGDGDEAISKAEVIRLINLYLFGPPTTGSPPGAPEGLTTAGNGPTRIDLLWNAPSSDGGAPITGYRIEVSEAGSTWTDLAANTGSGATSYSHTGLTAGSTRHYRVSAINSAGTGPASNIATGTTTPGATGTATSDRTAMIAFYNSMGGPNWANNTNWLSDKPVGDWYGITTDNRGRIIRISLHYNGLNGQIPLQFGDLDALEELELNGIDGDNPDLSALSDLPNLRFLSLHENGISDLSALTELPRLEALDLRNNRISDVSPLLTLLSSSNLRRLVLAGNPLSSSSVYTHIPMLEAGGVDVIHHGYALTGGDLTIEDVPLIYNDNLVVLPVTTGSSLQAYTRSFYKHFDDEFDFLVLVSPGFLEFELGPGGYYIGVANDVQGIGASIYSKSNEFGSADKLHGIPFFSHVHWFRGIILHEVLHRWAVSGSHPLASGDGHFAKFSNIFGAFGGYFSSPFEEIVDLGENRFKAQKRGWSYTYGPLELYFAGLIPPKDVPDFWVAVDGEWIDQESGTFTATSIEKYTASDIIAAYGRRVPEASSSQREFRAAVILLIDENDPTVDSMLLESLSTDIAWFSFPGTDEFEENNFYEATGGRATFKMDGLAEFRKNSATPPGAPTGLTAAGNGPTRIDLSWISPTSDGRSGITGYRIEVSEDRTDWSDLEADTGSTSTSYSHTRLTAGSTRHYRVSAINSVGTGPASNLAAARTSTTGTDRAALVALYNATNGPNWANDTNWLTDAPLGAWHGVSTDASGRVTALRLYENGLSGSIPSEMGNLTSLEELILVGNGITEISGLSEVVSLRVLGLDYNNIPDLSPLADLTNLTDLSLSDTNVPDLSVLSDLTNLTHLRLITTNTADLSPLSGLTNLTSLTLSHNSIADLSPLAELTNLTYLNFWENQIEDISALSGLTNLTGVGLGLNNVTDISALSGLTKLETLWLNNNNVTDISSLAGLTNLTELYLGTNSITDISALAELTSLMELDLASNNITDLAPLAGLTNLRNLDVRGNVLNDSSIAEHVPALESNGTVVLFDMRLSKGNFDIELVFLDDFTESQKRVLQYTALRWMAVIIEDVPEYEFTGVWSGQCGGQSFEIPSGERMDDLRIYVATSGQSPGIHGTGGIYVMREESHLPVVGCMTFDLSHANLLVTGLHEIGHVLGFASEMWNEFGFYQNPPNGDDHFSGPLAIAAFDAAGGSDYEGAKVPLRQGESHWRLSVLEGELMSPSGGGTLSAITVQSLADLGYGVDVAQADAYTLPRARGGG